MSNTEPLSYDDFWRILSQNYPISRGEFRLPIAVSPITIPNFDHDGLRNELHTLLQNLLNSHGTKEAAVARAHKAGESSITPLITEDFTGVIRFDCAIDAITKKVRIFEINCDYPDGLLLHDATYNLVSRTSNSLHTAHLTTLLKQFEQIYILYSKQANFLDAYFFEYEILKNILPHVEIGSDCNKALQGQLVRRCLEVTKFTDAELQVLATHQQRYINSFALRTLGYKDILSELTHHMIPQTQTVTKENIEEIITKQEHIVLKPKNGCEGADIFFGNSMNKTQWRDLVLTLPFDTFIAQELVSMERMAVTFYAENTIQTKELYYDICPHFFVQNGRVIGHGHTLMRFSDNQIINVSKGGGIGYYRL